MSEIELTRLFVYPIKSVQGIEVSHTKVLERGLEHDRRYMVVDHGGNLITARQHAKLLRVATAFEHDSLLVHAPKMPSLRLPLEGQGLEGQVRVWADWMPGLDAGETANAWFSEFLGMKARLVWMPEHSERRMGANYGPSKISFADGNPLHLVNEASLADLEARVGSEIALERFRPNLVVRGAAAYSEDTWTRLHFSSLELQPCEACARCMVVNLEPHTGEFSLEPLRTLAGYRRLGKSVLFGHHLYAIKGGTLRVGERGTVV